jgi:menaquinol-cytochrome c reductase cytochrome b/c subunit
VVGPFLLGVGNKWDAAKIEETVKGGFPPNMPAGGGLTKPEDIKAVAAWLAKQKQK